MAHVATATLDDMAHAAAATLIGMTHADAAVEAIPTAASSSLVIVRPCLAATRPPSPANLVIIRPYLQPREAKLQEKRKRSPSPANLVIICPYLQPQEAKHRGKQKRVNSPPHPGLSNLLWLPKCRRAGIYEELFERFDEEETMVGQPISRVHAIMQADAPLRRADMAEFYMNVGETPHIGIGIQHPPPPAAEITRWANSGICERIAYVLGLHLCWEVLGPNQCVEVSVSFRNELGAAHIEWQEEVPIHEDHKARFEQTVDSLVARTPDPSELAQMLQPYDQSWSIIGPAYSNGHVPDVWTTYGRYRVA